MNQPIIPNFAKRMAIWIWLMVIPVASFAAEPSPAAISAFNSYLRMVEIRLDAQHKAQGTLLAATAPADAQLRKGELAIEKLTPNSDSGFPGAMLHDWRGTAFAPGATVADFERLMQDFNAYPRHFSPQVLRARALGRQGEGTRASMRVRQKHVITVVMDINFAITFGRLDSRHGYSASRSSSIAEIDAPGTAEERVLGPGEAHGFLWRLNTYWSYEERDGGLLMQIESVSLTRSIPHGLGWAVGPFVESVPRESLEFTLRSVCNALRK